MYHPLTVLQVIPALVTGGAERGCVDVAVALAKAGNKPLVASEGGPMTRELDRVNVPHITLPLARKNPFIIWKNAGRLAQLIREHKVDVVHARSRAPAWSAWLACRRTGVPFMTTFHAAYNFTNMWKRRYNAIMAKGERVIAISRFIFDHITQRYGVDPKRVRLIHRGIDLDIFSPDRVPLSRVMALIKAWSVPEDKTIIMLPGRLTAWKGQSVLIEAMAKLKRSDVYCLLVGSDQGHSSRRERLIDQIKQLGLESQVKIVDHCSDMPAAYMLSHIVVSASTDPEAFGRVIVEAQAMGRPVIVTDHGAVDETIVPGRTGWAVPPGDAEALAQMLQKALGLGIEERLALASQAIAHARRYFSKEKMCAETLAVYRELVPSVTA